jgi:hypothetical protein
MEYYAILWNDVENAELRKRQGQKYVGHASFCVRNTYIYVNNKMLEAHINNE